MKYAILAIAATILLPSCYDRPVGVLSIPIYESDLKELQAKQKWRIPARE